MKNIFALTIMMVISSSAFAVAPFSGRIDYKVGDKIKYANQCVVRAQLDLGIKDTAIVLKICTNMFNAAGLLEYGQTVHIDLNGYSQTINCIVCEDGEPK